METLATDFLEPLWKQEEQFVVEKIFTFMKLDSLPTSRSISIDSTNPADIFRMFDSITYDKGSAIIRMMSMFLGSKTFQHAIRTYLKAFTLNSATQEDLWRYLSEATNNTIDVEQIMNGWTRQAGYPIIQINRINNPIQPYLIISQQPFTILSTIPKSNEWWIPFKYVDQTLIESELIWVHNTSITLPINTSDSNWILTNPNYLGIYRTKYDQDNFRLILTQLQTDHTQIPSITRGVLIDDTFALLNTDLIDATDAYELIRYLKNENEYVPWMATVSAMEQQEQLLYNHDIYIDVQSYFLELLLPIYNQIGWIEIDSSKEWLQSLLQPSIVSIICHYKSPECIESSRTIYRRWSLNPNLNQIPANLRSIVYCTVVREGSQKEFDFLWNRLEKETVANEILNLLKGLSCTEDPSLILWFLNQHLINESIIRDQDGPFSICNVARSSRGNEIVWNWIRDNWSFIFHKWGITDNNLDQILDAISTRFVTIRQQDQFKTFADSIIDKGSLSRQFQLSMDKINANIQWNKQNLHSIIQFFRSNDNQTSNSNHRLPLNIVPIHYDLYVKPYLNITNENLRYSVFDGQVRIHLNVIHRTDRIVLHKRFISIEEPIEINNNISIISTIFNSDLDFFTIILNRSLEINEKAILTLNYIGQLKNDTEGFYVSSYVRSSDKIRRYLIASQMQPIAARRAFPCFDEPHFKATFTLTVEHEQQYRVWSNMPIQNTTIQSNHFILTQFQTTPLMSSYLLALVVADFHCLTKNNTGRFANITTSVCAQPEKINDLNYALEIATENMRHFEEQYQINYPLTKCDHIAVPDFDAGWIYNSIISHSFFSFLFF